MVCREVYVCGLSLCLWAWESFVGKTAFVGLGKFCREVCVCVGLGTYCRDVSVCRLGKVLCESLCL